MKHEVIQFIGVSDLPTVEQAIVNDLSTEYYEKIRRSLQNMTSLVVHLKEYRSEGNRHKYAIVIRAMAPSHTFTSSKEADWDLARTLHKSFANIMNQIEHQLNKE